MTQQSKRYVMLGFLSAVALGGVVGYMLANQAAAPTEQFRPVSNVIVAPEAQPVAPIQNNQPAAQPAPIVVDESDSVAAVVTVLNRQGRFGGGSGSGVFISESGYVVTVVHTF